MVPEILIGITDPVSDPFFLKNGSTAFNSIDLKPVVV